MNDVTPKSVVYNDDCLAAMKKMRDNQFSLAIPDPEYGIGAGTMTMGRGSRNDTGKNTLKNWDASPPSQEYFDELFRISVNQIIWGGNYFLDKICRPARCFLIWDKMDYNSDFASAELAWTSFDSVTKTFRRARNLNTDFKIHPTQKPASLYRWILKNYAKPGDTILDTHGGSFSSRIACWDLGFDFEGYEIDKDYVDEAEERFQRHIAQGKLFEPIQIKPKQSELF